MKFKPHIAAKIVTVLSCLFIILFVYAAGSKYNENDVFLSQVGQSPMLTWWASVVVVLVPAMEVVIALLLVFKITRLVGLYAFFTMMVMFSTYIIMITRYSDFVPCSCGGILANMTWGTHLQFNLLFVALAAFAIVIYPPRTIQPSIARGELSYNPGRPSPA